METHIWRQADALLEQALELEEPARGAFVQRILQQDPRLGKLLEELLTVTSSDVDFLDHPALSDDAAPCAGTFLDQYEVLEEIGRGGMSVVLKGIEHHEDYHRTVAVKILKKGMDSEHFIQRFQRERHILASLNHPRIAALINAGTAQDGRPYLVMPYIEGHHLAEHCGELSLRERLELFIKICRTVAFAHRNLVVHRDLKPNNILVDEYGEPVLLDFGIAKLIQDQDEVHTQTAQRMYTPQYASPEQLEGKPITTACDIYALGIIFYELLTGERPFQTRGAALLSQIQGGAEKPSRRLKDLLNKTNLTEPAFSVKKAGIQPRQLQGDLDVIAQTALRYDPERRYASVHAFADDVEAYLQGFPIRARSEKFGYILSKWIRRNRARALLLALAAQVTIGFLSLTAYQNHHLEQARHQAEAAKVRSDRERDRAQKISGFLTNLFTLSDPWADHEDDLSARTLLDRAAAEIQNDEELDAQTRAALLHTMGKVYLQLGLTNSAQPLLTKAYAFRKEQLQSPQIEDGPNPMARLSLAETEHELGKFYLEKGLFQDSVQHLEAGLSGLEEILGAEHEQAGVVQINLATTLYRMGRFAEAEGHAARAVKILNQSGRGNPLNLADAHLILGEVLFRLSRFDESGTEIQQALNIYQTLLPEDHPSIATAKTSLANHYTTVGRYQDAVSILNEALIVMDRRLGPDNRKQVTPLLVLGAAHIALNQYEQAETALQKGLGQAIRSVGENHPLTAVMYGNLGELYKDTGELEKAVAHHRRAHEIRRKVLPEQHPGRALSLYQYADSLRASGDFSKHVEEMLLEALAIRRMRPDAQHQWLAATLHALGLFYIDTGAYQTALPHLDEAVLIRRDLFGDDHQLTALTLFDRARTCFHLERWEQALADCRLALATPTGPKLAEQANYQAALALEKTILAELGKREAVTTD